MKTFIALLFLSLFAFAAPAQSKPECDHSRWRIARFRSVRTMIPVKVTRVAETEIEVTAEDDVELLSLTLKYDKSSVVPKDFKPRKEKLFWILYCELCFHLYSIWDYEPKKQSPK